jgi:hypothetical protein
VIRIPAEIARATRVLLGDPQEVDNAPEVPFHPLRIDFLAEVSRLLLNHPGSRAHPDVAAFAFWCRRAGLERQAALWDRSALRMGLGLVFHVSPANVPVQFAYSLVFALLAGNASVVRLSTRESAQADLVIEVLARVLEGERFVPLRGAIHLVRYGREDAVTEFWLRNSLGRILWGGDETVAHLRSLPTHPRSREIAFADRYSFAVLDARKVAQAEAHAIRQLCAGLYNDIYPMNQAACSSPQLLAWVGTPEEVTAAQERLWPPFLELASRRYDPEPIDAMDKYVGLCSEIIVHDNVGAVRRFGATLARVQLDKLESDPCGQRGYFGTVHEHAFGTLAELACIVDPRFQTMAYFGFESQSLRDFVLAGRLSGIDRIVPIGRALDMGFLWDGYDLVAALSRRVDVQ